MNAPTPTDDDWSFACPDWWERLQQGRSLLPTLPLDMAEAERAVGIYNKFCLPDVAGNPSLGEVGGDWFRDFIRAIFGSLDRNGRRRVKKLLGLVPKKQSKTTNSAALMLTGLLINQRPRADFINVAPTKLLAEIAYEQAVGMIDSDPEGYLQKRFRPRDHLKQIDDLLMDAVWKIRAFDLNVTNGIIPAGILIDELHLIAQDPNAARVIGQLIGGMLPILESFCLYITSQSDEPPVGVFKTELARARAIRDGRIKGDLLPFLYEFPTEIQGRRKPLARSIDLALCPAESRPLGADRGSCKRPQRGRVRRQKGSHPLGLPASQHPGRLTAGVGFLARHRILAPARRHDHHARSTARTLRPYRAGCGWWWPRRSSRSRARRP